jgi:hypothetical protein
MRDPGAKPAEASDSDYNPEVVKAGHKPVDAARKILARAPERDRHHDAQNGRDRVTHDLVVRFLDWIL